MSFRFLSCVLLLSGAFSAAPGCRYGYGYEFAAQEGSGSVSASGGRSTSGGTGAAISTGSTSMGGSASEGGSVLGAFGSAPYCELLHRLPAAPEIDGVLDAGPPLQAIEPKGFVPYNGLGSEYQVQPADVSSRFAAAWVEEGLYFFIEVTDPDLIPAPTGDLEWRGDSYEIYVDHDASFAPPGEFDDPGTRQFIVAAPPDDSTDATRAGSYTIIDRVEDFAGQWVSKPHPGGYIVEAFVRAADLGLDTWGLSVGAPVAFDLSHNISLPPGETGIQENLLGQYFLEVAEPFTGADEELPYSNSAVFCTPELALP